MDYELAKQLKDAGFPKNIDFHHNCDIAQTIDVINPPTLSELIEACGDEFKSVEKDFRIKHWEAWDRYGAYGKGKTPEEAVANLWLELNK